ncbi:MAG TPA: DUF4340 domain-containing protein [Thermoanaerobaculia bacterium]|nr:DUF4340 domain-containing protein [Thermoanaerobaculia bacterium]
MRPRSLLVLALVVAALAAFVWFYERELPTTEEREQQAKRVLPGLEQDEVRELRIEREGETVRLVRQQAPEAGGEGDAGDGEDREGRAAAPDGEPEWRLVEPLAAAADRFAVDGLVRRLVELEKERTLEGVARDEHGLDPPAARVTLVTEDGERELLVGSQVPATSERAVAVAGQDGVHTVGDTLWSDLVREPGEWRSREVFTWQRADVERVALAGGGERLVLARRDDDFWIEAPIVDLADSESVDRLLNGLVGLSVSRFLDQAAGEDTGLEPARASVEVVLRGRKEPVRLLWGAPAGETEEHYARLGAQTFTATGPFAELAGREPAAWRSRALTTLPLYAIDEIEVSGEGGALGLERRGADWRRGEETILYGTVSDLLMRLTDAEATAMLSREEAAARGYDLRRPRLQLALGGEDGTQELALYAAGSEGTPATVEGRDVVLLLSEETAAGLQEAIAAVRSAEALAAEPETEVGAASPGEGS